MKATKLLKSISLSAGIVLAVLAVQTPKTSADFSISVYSDMYGYNYQPVNYPQIVGYVCPEYNSGLRVANATVEIYEVTPTWYFSNNLQMIGSVSTDSFGNYYFDLANYGYNYYDLYASQRQFVVRAYYQGFGLYGGDNYLTFNSGTTLYAPLILDMTNNNYFGPYSYYSGYDSGFGNWLGNYTTSFYNPVTYCNPTFSLFSYVSPNYDYNSYYNNYYSQPYTYNLPSSTYNLSDGVNYYTPGATDYSTNSYLGDNSYADSIWNNTDKNTYDSNSSWYNESTPTYSGDNTFSYTPNSYDSIGLNNYTNNNQYGSSGLDSYNSSGLNYDSGYGSSGLDNYSSSGLDYGSYGSSGLGYDSGYGSSGLGDYGSSGLGDYGSSGL